MCLVAGQSKLTYKMSFYRLSFFVSASWRDAGWVSRHVMLVEFVWCNVSLEIGMLCTDGGMCSLQLACASRLFTHSNPSHNDDDFEAETNAKARTALLQHRLLVMNDKSFIVITTQNFPHSPVFAYNIFFCHRCNLLCYVLIHIQYRVIIASYYCHICHSTMALYKWYICV